MSIFARNRFGSVSTIEVEPAQGYYGEAGSYLSMIESYQDDMEIFKAMILHDVEEADIMAGEGGYMTESVIEELGAIQENFVMNFFSKIKEFFMKLLARIKNIFKGFIAKVESMFTSDIKGFYDKHKKTIYGKDLSKFKIKVSKPKPSGIPDFKISYTLDVEALSESDKLDSLIEDFDSDDEKEKIIALIASGLISIKDFEKEFHELCFEDADEEEGMKAVHIVEPYCTSNKQITNIKKANDSLTKAIADIIKEIEKSKTILIKDVPFKDDESAVGKNTINVGMKKSFTIGEKTNGKYAHSSTSYKTTTTNNKKEKMQNIQKAFNLVHMKAGCVQSVINMYTAATMRETKFGLSQAKRVIAAAVAHNGRSYTESALLEQVFAEAAEYSVVSELETI